MSSSLEDVGKSPGGDSIVSFLRVSHNDDGTLKGGGTGTLAQVLALGHDANATQINNLADPSIAQDAATKHYVDTAVSGTVASSIPVTFSQPGVLATGTGTMRWLCPWTSTTINYTVAAVGTAPTGASIICDVKKNGTTVYTTSANRPTIVAGANATTTKPTPDVTAFNAGDYLTVDIVQVGATIAGSDLVIVVALTRTA